MVHLILTGVRVNAITIVDAKNVSGFIVFAVQLDVIDCYLSRSMESCVRVSAGMINSKWRSFMGVSPFRQGIRRTF